MGEGLAREGHVLADPASARVADDDAWQPAPRVDARHAADVLEATRRRWRRQGQLGLGAAAVVVLCLAYAGAFETDAFARGGKALANLLFVEGLPPDFQIEAAPFEAWLAGSRERSLGGAIDRSVPWLIPLWDTLVMSVAGTLLAIAMSVVVGIFGARNTSPHPAIYHASRLVMNATRAIPELIMGIVFLIAVGPGILPGILALAVHSVGMVGKFFAEAIEHVDPAPVEAARAAGASRFQIVLHGVLPQVLPQMADVSLYRWEYNFRASTVLGLVGCGGIGLMIQTSLSLLEYRQTTALLLLVLGCVCLVDAAGALLRRRLT